MTEQTDQVEALGRKTEGDSFELMSFISWSFEIFTQHYMLVEKKISNINTVVTLLLQEGRFTRFVFECEDQTKRWFRSQLWRKDTEEDKNKSSTYFSIASSSSSTFCHTALKKMFCFQLTNTRTGDKTLRCGQNLLFKLFRFFFVPFFNIFNIFFSSFFFLFFFSKL